MASNSIDDEISQTQENSGKALNGALLSFIGMLLALGIALFALAQANTAQQRVQELEDKYDAVQTRMNVLTGQGDVPSTGAGIGPNNPVEPAEGNQMPNANGQ